MFRVVQVNAGEAEVDATIHCRTIRYGKNEAVLGRNSCNDAG